MNWLPAQFLSLLADRTPDMQSVLNPTGASAGYIDALFWRTLWTLVAVYVIVVAAALVPAFRSRRQSIDPTFIHPEPSAERRLTIVVSSAVGITIVILFVILVGDFIVGNKSRALGRETVETVVRVTGHQWWWEVTYQDSHPARTVTDANEIHIPVGQTVRLDLRSSDVIHSFWAPNLSGKKDLIPGHPTSLFIRADHTGTYWAQCAEFCGFQHAQMRLAVVVQSPSDYSAWLDAARQNAAQPATKEQMRGMQVFMAGTCSMCHSIQGTSAGGRLGPDLTHIASRQTIASGSLANTMGNLGGWVTDPQGIKPGVIMPQHSLKGDDLQALLEYLENLK